MSLLNLIALLTITDENCNETNEKKLKLLQILSQARNLYACLIMLNSSIRRSKSTVKIRKLP